MKNKIILYSFLLILSTLSSINSLEEEESSSNIINILNYFLNGTYYPVNLSEIQDEFIYFTFDFESHINEKTTINDTIFFNMELDSEGKKLDDDSLSYIFSEKNWHDIKNEDLKNLTWNKKEIAFKNENNYYYKIKATDFEKKSLLLRVSIKNIKTGFLTGINVSAIPAEDNSSKTISGNILLKAFGLLFFLLNIW